MKKKRIIKKFFRFIRFSTKGPPTRSASTGTNSPEIKKPSLSESFPVSLVHQYTGGLELSDHFLEDLNRFQDFFEKIKSPPPKTYIERYPGGTPGMDAHNDSCEK